MAVILPNSQKLGRWTSHGTVQRATCVAEIQSITLYLQDAPECPPDLHFCDGKDDQMAGDTCPKEFEGEVKMMDKCNGVTGKA